MVPDLSVVVPVHRSAATLGELRERILRACEGYAVEIVFVDDACPQGSLAVLQELARSDSRVVVVALARHVGQHQAVLTGLAYARGRWTAIMDADLQDPPEALPLLLARVQTGYGAVFAGRRGRYESVVRLTTSRLFKWTLHVLAGVPADAGMFCLLSRTMVDRLLAMTSEQPSVVAMIGCSGLPMASVPVIRAERQAGLGPSAYDTRARATTAWQAIVWAVRWKVGKRRVRPPSQGTAVTIKAVYGRPSE